MYVVPAPEVRSVAVAGEARRFPIHRVYCIGRNYADHAREMGAAVDREAPIFFSKPADAVIDCSGPGAIVPYPTSTTSLHHEVELVVALAGGGRDVERGAALDLVYGYAVGLDLTRRDLQAEAKKKGLPWDAAKAFDGAAPLGAITPASRVGHPSSGGLFLDVNDEPRQRGDVASMVFVVPEIIAALSRLFTLCPGDLIFTGTPAGVAELARGDRFSAGFPGLASLKGSIA